MLTRWKLAALAVGVALLVGVAGVGAAFAAGTPTPTAGSTYHDQFVGKVAAILGVDQGKVDAAFTQARGEMIDEAVKNGQITQQQADFMKQHLAQDCPAYGSAMNRSGFGPGMMGGGVGPGYGPGMMRGGVGPWSAAPTATPAQ